MKKLTRILLIASLCLSMLAMSGCSKDLDMPYSEYDLSEYVTLPDYDTFTTREPKVEVTDADVDEEIESRLDEAGTTRIIKEGKVEKGDKVKIAYEGKLADGYTEDGMKSEGYDLTLGNANMIDGFQEGLYGATIGEPVTLELKFPEEYGNEKLNGQDVTFEVTVLQKEERVAAELNEDFIKKDSDKKASTEEEYRELIKKELEESKTEEELETIKSEIYQQIIDETEVIKYPEKEVQAQTEALNAQYQQSMQQAGYSDWDKYLSETMGIEQAEYDEQIKLYAESIIKQEMVIFAIAEKEGLKLNEKEYEDYLDEMLERAGYEDADAFEEAAGMTIREYGDQNKLDRNFMLSQVLDLLYDRLEKVDDSADDKTDAE